MKKPDNPITKRLVDHYGGKQEAAKALEVNPETIRLWLRDGIPLAKAIEVERDSRGVVTAEEILRDKKRPAKTAPERAAA